MEITNRHVNKRSELLKAIKAEIAARASASDQASLQEFSVLYLNFFPLEAWVGRELPDLYGFLYGLWCLIQTRPGNAAKVSVFNPNIEEHGWMCGRTVITVVQRDMPFLVDSLRLELNQRNLPVHVVQSTVIAVDRDPQGQLIALRPKQTAPGPEVEAEALIYLEVSLQTQSHELSDIRRALERILVDVDNVVSDYGNVRRNLDNTVRNLSASGPDSMEATAFLDWLTQKNFTFLGFRHYDLIERDSNDHELRESVSDRLGIFRKLDVATTPAIALSSNRGTEQFHKSDDLICFSKSSTRSSVHRGVYPDYIVVKRFDAAGKVIGEDRYLGLFTYEVSGQSPFSIPLLRKNVEAVVARTQLDVNGYYGRSLVREIDLLPKEELFQSDVETLFNNITTIASINGRHVVRLIVRADPFGSFVNCMVFVPRDLYDTNVRLKIEKVLGEALGTTECDATSFFSESTLARAQLVFKVDDDADVQLDIPAIESAIRDIVNNWDSHLQQALIDQHGEAAGLSLYSRYAPGFSQAYKESYDARTGMSDIAMLETVKGPDDIAMNLYRPIGADETALRFKILYPEAPLELSRVIPMLEHLGLRVLEEHPYKIRSPEGGVVWLHDFNLTISESIQVDVQTVRAEFEAAFANILRGHTENDGFNRLVLGARLNWREVGLLRAYASYIRQIGFISTQQFIADTLVQNPDITRNLIALFRANFDPRLNKHSDSDERRIERLQKKIIGALDDVANLNEDLILRRYLDLINATLRTNYFQADSQGRDKSYIAIKLSPREIADMPKPRPMFEIFVYSPRVEGVHLRGGKVSRGGLRWSDRLQDYRTEVLGLVKAQQVKNAVIVPNGAKGGFVAKQLSKDMSRDEYLAEGVECYKIFIRGLLDVTDNLVDAEVICPANVIPKDWEDPYLVVAADRGTATFSDIANGIAAEYGFWLGDAFASGGSQGYDHKGMGITAKGAWISVQRHFREQGIDIQSEKFSVIGIGDMAGDVFGNGMLLSKQICLTAAFNHLHIFIDPTPDAEASFLERERLFAEPRSAWSDYNLDLISKGGGVFSRSEKSIKISAPMKKAFDIEADSLTPNDLINALLKAPVDLIWNGGIGTYVKASWESHAVVGDKANDSLRVNGDELRCKVFGEGGNLGLTQLARVEYALHGGACNTDFIDNAGGVDCSDHEVNIKILLDEIVKNGDMTSKQRNQLLSTMTDEVADLVLRNNYRQTLAISMAEYEVPRRLTEYRRFINYLESKGRLDRKLEYLPTDEAIGERQGQYIPLTRPELSVLICYAKVMLKEGLAASEIAEDAYIAQEVKTAFPVRVSKKYAGPLNNHRLKREIIATQLANDMINNLGITAGHRLLETTGASIDDIARAYVVSRDVFQFESFQAYIGSLDNRVPAEFQYELMSNMIRRVRRGTRWLLRNHRAGLQPAREVATFREGLVEIQNLTGELIQGVAREEWEGRRDHLIAHHVIDEWATPLSMPANLFSGLSIVHASASAGKPLRTVGEIFYRLLEDLSLSWFATQISEVRVETYWQAIAREGFIDDLEAQLRKITITLARTSADESLDDLISRWSAQHVQMISRWRAMVSEVQGASQTDYAMFAVAMRELIDLAQATQHGTHT